MPWNVIWFIFRGDLDKRLSFLSKVGVSTFFIIKFNNVKKYTNPGDVV